MIDLAKLVRSTMNTHLNTNKSIYTMFEEGTLPDDPSQPCFEVRHIGPDVEKEGATHHIDFGVEILCLAPISQNIYAVDRLFDHIVEVLEMPIPIGDDCLHLKDKIRVSRFGKLGRFYQGTVTADYETTVGV